jgi:hypothetical protein
LRAATAHLPRYRQERSLRSPTGVSSRTTVNDRTMTPTALRHFKGPRPAGMDEFLKILQDMNGAATNPKQLLSRQASRHDEMRENRFGTTHTQSAIVFAAAGAVGVVFALTPPDDARFVYLFTRQRGQRTDRRSLGARSMPRAVADTRQNLSRSRPRSFSPRRVQRRERSNRRQALRASGPDEAQRPSH